MSTRAGPQVFELTGPPMILLHPPGADWLFVLAHGAGAGPTHPFLEGVARALAERRIATLRDAFPYVLAGRRRPDRAETLIPCVRAAIAHARSLDLRIAAGGKSMGGRMTSLALAEAPEERVERVVFLGFPLHPARRPGTARAAHLERVGLPMLFVRGDRDALAEPELLRPIVAGLARATLVEIPGADHGFEVPKRSGRGAAEVQAEIAAAVRDWLDR